MSKRKELIDNFTNKEYLKKHILDYGELIANEFHPNTLFKKNPKLVLDRFDVFYLVMNMIKNGDLKDIRSSVTSEILESYMFRQ